MEGVRVDAQPNIWAEFEVEESGVEIPSILERKLNHISTCPDT